jgi:hypothetical protein
MGNWDNLTEEEIEKFIRDNKDKFEKVPRPELEDSFLKKLMKLFKKAIVSIVPYLYKVAIITVLIWAISYGSWRLWIDPNRYEMPLRKVDLKHREIEYRYQFNERSKRVQLDYETRKNLRKELAPLDSAYRDLKRELKKDPENQRIINAMIQVYEERRTIIDTVIQRTKRINSKNLPKN